MIVTKDKINVITGFKINSFVDIILLLETFFENY